MLRPQPIECPGGIHHLMRRGAQTPMTRAWTAAGLSMGIASDLSGLLGEAKLSIASSDPLSVVYHSKLEFCVRSKLESEKEGLKDGGMKEDLREGVFCRMGFEEEDVAIWEQAVDEA